MLAPAAQAKDADVRFSTFNASLNRFFEGQLAIDLSTPNNQQAKNVAETIQRYRPDVLLINEFDYWAANPQRPVDLFRDNYLEVSQNGAAPIEYPYSFIAPSNTGIHSGFDLNNFGGIVSTPLAPGYGDDAYGFGEFPGKFGMVVYSKYPIDAAAARTFQLFRWTDMPGNLMPTPFYSPDRGGDLPPLVEEPLGPTDHNWEEDSALPGLAPDPAGVRRAGGPQRPSEQRRDPLLGRLHHPGAARATSTTTTVSPAG